MAISKERLEELINNGATIYTIKHIGGDVMELHLKNISDDFWYFLLGMTEELFEDKAEVEEKAKKIKWSLKYHATRTEELNLPMWEEIEKIKEKDVYIIAKPKEMRFYIDYKFLIPQIKLCTLEDVFNWNLDEEGYLSACDLCLKLFKGKKNENNMHTRRQH